MIRWLVCWILFAPGLLQAAELGARISEIMATVPAGAEVGVAVFDTVDNRWLYQRGADQPLSLASTTKLMVAAAALLGLGTDYRFHTRLVGLGPVVDGSLPGLGVIGGGSPCLDEHFTDHDPDLFFREWAQELRRQGIVRVAGDLVIDNRLFSGPIRPDTYPQDAKNQQCWYSAPACAFAWNDNCIETRVVPTAAGQPCEVQIQQRSSRIQVHNQTRTLVGAGDGRVAIARELKGNVVNVSGTCDKTTAWFPLAIQADPDLLNGDQLKAILADQGIPITGEVRLGAVDPKAGPLLIDLAQELVPAVTLMNQHSQNFYGEQLLRLLGVARRQEGSIAAGLEAVIEILRKSLGEEFAAVQILDGSGLSYGNRASATCMVDLLVAMLKTPVGDLFVNSLKDKDVGRAHGHVKTGSLAIANCLVGYVDPPGGHRLAFAILLNAGEANGIGWAVKVRDRIYQAIGE